MTKVHDCGCVTDIVFGIEVSIKVCDKHRITFDELLDDLIKQQNVFGDN